MIHIDIKKLRAVRWVAILCLWLAATALTQAQDATQAVLVMDGEDFATYYNTGLNLQTLLDHETGSQGSGEATLEFWAKSTGNGKSWALANGQHFRMQLSNQGVLTTTDGTTTHQVTLRYGGEELAVWHHMALVFDQGGTRLTIYQNSSQLAQYEGMAFGSGQTNSVHLYKAKESLLYFTEVRAWDRARDQSEVLSNQYVLFSAKSNDLLASSYENDGLLAYYGESTFSTPGGGTYTPLLEPMEWHNYVAQLASWNVSGVNDGRAINMADSYALTSVRTDVDHPLDDADVITLAATKGSQEEGILVRWVHVNPGINRYIVRRNGVLMQTYNDFDADAIGLFQTILDEDVIPGQVYTYKVTGYKSDDISFAANSNEEAGYKLYNGKLTGTILSRSLVAVDSVAVSATPSTQALPGYSLMGGTPVTLSNAQDLRNASELTISFWYKANSSADTHRNVVSLGNTEIWFAGSTLTATNGSETLSSTITEAVTNWHQYTIVFGNSSSNGALYQDGVLLSSGALDFVAPNGSETLTFNGEDGDLFSLDELCIWGTARTGWEVAADYSFLRNTTEENLLVYFRFDMAFENGVYDFIGREAFGENYAYPTNENSSLSFNAEQPDALTAGAYTDEGGNYLIETINYGTAGSMSFTVTPQKTNHEFSPESSREILSVSEDYRQYQKLDIDFTDISQLPVSGTFYYLVAVDGTEEQYPVPTGQQVTRNGDIAHGDYATTDRFGQYQISASVGTTTFAPYNPTKQRAFGYQSVYFNGTAHMESAQSITLATAATWSFYVRPAAAAASVASQTLWELGDLRLDLENNEYVVLYDNGIELVRSTYALETDLWAFIGLSLTDTQAEITVQGQGTTMPGLSGVLTGASGTLFLGADATATQHFTGHIDHLGYRNTYYNANELAELEDGSYMAGDADYTSETTDHLQALWAFNEFETNDIPLKALSSHSGATAFVLTHVGTLYDNNEYSEHTQGYQLAYTAHSSDNPTIATSGESYPNVPVVTPLSGMDFINTTRYGISGQLATPCGYSVGEWTGKVVRTDLNGYTYERALTADDWNADYTLFAIDGLMPGSYRIELEHKGIQVNGIYNGSGQILRSPIIAVLDGWQTYSFTYREPLTISTQLVGVATAEQDNGSNFTFADYTSQCADKTVVKTGVAYKVQVTVAEDYSAYQTDGGTYTCAVANAILAPSGDIGPTYVISGTHGLVTDATGVGYFGMVAGAPNFEAAENYLRYLNVVAYDDYHDAVTTSLAGVVLGRVQYDNDFTLQAPETLVGILHDPPGDNSYATLSQGTSFYYTKELTTGDSDEVLSYTGGGWHYEADAVTVVSSMKITESRGVGGIAIYDYSIDARTGTTYERLELTQDISTSNLPVNAGYRSDVFIGYSSVIRMGSGDELMLENCEVVHQQSVDVNVLDEVIPFFHTHHEIEYTLIPNLEVLIADANTRLGALTAGSDDYLNVEVERDNYVNQRDQWQSLLEENLANVNKTESLDAFTLGSSNVSNDRGAVTLPQNLAFSGGTGALSYQLGTESDNSTGDYYYSEAGTGEYGYAYGMASIITVESETEHFAMGYQDKYNADGEGSSTLYTIVFDDDDEGDQFEVVTGADPTGGLPIFKTMSGRSMCPYEEGTVNRESMELKVTGANYQQVSHGETAVFELTLTNNQPVDDGTDKTFYVWLDHASNEEGANVSMNGDFMITPVPYHLNYGESTTAWVSIEEGVTDFTSMQDIRIYVASACEYDQGTMVYTEEILFTDDKVAEGAAGDDGMRIRDWVDLSVDFVQPCAQSVTLNTPTNQWVVNSNDNNALPFRFAVVPGLENLNGLRVEYTTSSNNEVLNLVALDLTTVNWTDGSATGDTQQATDLAALGLSLQTDGSYTYTADVSGLSNGAYNFRIAPVCPTSERNPSDWVSGGIFREVPVITSVAPYDNSYWNQGNIVVGYNRQISTMNLNPSNITLRGMLAGVEYTMYAGALLEATDGITIPHTEALNLDSAYTLEAWLHPTAYPASEVTVIDKGTQLSLTLDASGHIGHGRTSVSSNALPLNTWTHVAVVYDGDNTVTTYFNGVQESQDTGIPGYATNTDDLTVAQPAAGGESFVGYIDELRVWAEVRSDLALQSNRGNMLVGNEPNLRAYFPLDNNALEGDAIRDFTGNASGTTATGLGFAEVTAADGTLSADEAVVTIPLDIHHQGNQIVVVPTYNPYYLEGSLLTATIADGKVQDLYGNTAEGKTWTFRYDMNGVRWNQGGVIEYVNEGESLTFSLELENQGAATTTYRLSHIPDWLSLVGSTAHPDSYRDHTNIYLGWGFTHNFTFSVPSTLPAGVYQSLITAETDRGQEDVWVELYVGQANYELANYARVQAGMGSLEEIAEPSEAIALTAYPNPFREATEFRYTLAETALVHLEVVDLLGRPVATLVDQDIQFTGTHTANWDVLAHHGGPLSTGVYLAILTVNGEKTVSRVVISE